MSVIFSFSFERKRAETITIILSVPPDFKMIHIMGATYNGFFFATGSRIRIKILNNNIGLLRVNKVLISSNRSSH